MCTLDAQCDYRIRKLQNEISKLENKIKNEDPIACNSLTFSHVALEDAQFLKIHLVIQKLIV